MKFGMCGGFDAMRDARAAGFDYLELPVTGVAALTDAEFEQRLAELTALGLPVPSCNVLFPGEIRLHDPSVTDDRITAYLEKAFARLQRLGTETVVFGSGGARKRPEGVSYGDAFRRLVTVARLVGDAAARYGLTVVIEPLCRKETNMINSLAEGACLVAAADHPRVKLLADTYHITRDGEPMSDIGRVGGVSHVHVATKVNRRYPTVAEPELAECFAQLKATGYSGNVSVEGGSDDRLTDGPLALAVLKKLWEEA